MKLSIPFQPTLFNLEEYTDSNHAKFNGRSGAFVDNMSLPVHRWFRYSAGFSADWVRLILLEQKFNKDSITILDPFCGVGTSVLACAAENVTGIGFEAHPFVYRIANAKLKGIHANPIRLKSIFQNFANAAADLPAEEPKTTPSLLSKCYSPETLSSLMAMRNLFLAEYDANTSESELLWLALTSILRTCSGVGTAQWQYILPNKTKSVVQKPLTAFISTASTILNDIEYATQANWANTSRVIKTDARFPVVELSEKVDLVITSPPYPNNYDYADSTRLEMTFWGEIEGWGDLQNNVRKFLIHSCSQHTAAEKLVLDDLLSDSVLAPIQNDLADACRQLAEIRETKGGKKTYHTMAAAYFRDLGLVFKSLRLLCHDDSLMCFVVGDSAPYGIYLNVEEWLGKLAVGAGFSSYSYDKIRDRNTKWKNRKHTVPLKEGRLWIRG